VRFDGILRSWNDERGFGYIEPSQGGEPIFVHASVWPRGSGRPRLNQTLSFEVERGPKGKRAKNVQLLRPRRAAKPSGRSAPAPRGLAGLFTLPAFLTLYIVVAVTWKIPLWVAGLYVAASTVTFIAYAADKAAAARGTWRTPETSLHALAIVGGWPGALIAQQLLRHKSIKQGFRQVFWATVAINVIAFVVLASSLRRTFLGLQ
jgi:uncharacterized membrane protein YsdA (DUF1294 family)/cold shock CspA family protein